MWFLPLLFGGSLPRLLSIALSFIAELTLKLISFVLYLASEYWGRWVLFAAIVAVGLLYGRWHYIELGREREAGFRAILIDKALGEQCQVRKKRTSREWTLPEGWPGG